MAITATQNPQITGTDQNDLLIQISSPDAGRLDGGNGHDLIYGDLLQPFIDDSSANATAETAMNLDDPAFWTTTLTSPVYIYSGSAIPEVVMVPRMSVLATGTGTHEFYSVTVGAGEWLTVTVDHRIPHDPDLRDWWLKYLVYRDTGPSGSVDESDILRAGSGFIPGTLIDDPSLGIFGLRNYQNIVTYLNTSDQEERIIINLSAISPEEDNLFRPTLPPAPIPDGAGVLVDVTVTGHAATGGGLPSSDTLIGGRGRDTLHGGGGDDRIDGGSNHDILFGGLGRDTLTGGTGDDHLDGGLDADTLEGSHGRDTLVGQDGDDLLRGGGGRDSIHGGIGNDTLYGEHGTDKITGGDGHDLIFGGRQDDRLYGGSGDDRIFGGSSNDIIEGGTGRDDLDGGIGHDLLHGGALADTLDGGDDNDTLSGGAGWDLMFGASGVDDLYGGSGHDTLIGGADDDRLAGGSGRDVFVFTEDWGADVIDDFDAYDGEKIAFAASTGITGFDDLIANHLRVADGAAEIHAGAQTIRLSGVGLEDIGADRAYSSDDFVFFTLTQDLIDQWTMG